MHYRTLGRTGIRVGEIGLGVEHFERSAEVMDAVLHTAVDAGVNYIDLVYNDTDAAAWFWDDFTPTLRAHRDKLILAAHWGPQRPYDFAKCRAYFDQVLERIGNGYAEVAIIAVVDSDEQWRNEGQEALEHLLRYKEQGKIGHIGVSGHTSSVACAIAESGVVDVIMFGMSLVTRGDAEIDAVVQSCRDHDIGFVAMKPYHGGVLLTPGGRPSGITPVQCISYVLDQPIATVVPGASNVEHLNAALRYCGATEHDRDYTRVLDVQRYLKGQCVYCHHCEPCPEGIRIGDVLWILDAMRGPFGDDLRAWYNAMKVKAPACTECGVCLDRCPYEVEIIAKLHKAAELLDTPA
jgi:predicted aldo/keto reductase-like oxidoreductase